MGGTERNKKQGDSTASVASWAVMPRDSWARGTCFTERLALKYDALEKDESACCCLGSVVEQSQRSALAGKARWWRMACWFSRPRYVSKKSLVKQVGQTELRFVLSLVMSVFFFSNFVSYS